jgi:hypothetical protein
MLSSCLSDELGCDYDAQWRDYIISQWCVIYDALVPSPVTRGGASASQTERKACTGEFLAIPFPTLGETGK